MFERYKNSQAAADAFKRLVLDAPAPRAHKQGVLAAINRLERSPWHPRAMEDSIAGVVSLDSFEIDEFDRLNYIEEGMPHAVMELIHRILDRYAEVMPPEDDQRLFSTLQAAEYLGLTLDGLKYHINRKGNLTGTKVGRDYVFTVGELEDFKARMQPPGRPKQNGD